MEKNFEVENVKITDLEEYDSDYEEYILEEPEKTSVYKYNLEGRNIIFLIEHLYNEEEFLYRSIVDRTYISKSYKHDNNTTPEIIFIEIEERKSINDKEKYIKKIQIAWKKHETRRIKREIQVKEKRKRNEEKRRLQF